MKTVTALVFAAFFLAHGLATPVRGLPWPSSPLATISDWVASLSAPQTKQPVVHKPKCPCSQESLCKPIKGQRSQEVMGFFWPPTQNFSTYDWSQLSSVAWAHGSELLCTAHAHGARVILNADNCTEGMMSSAGRKQWVAATLQLAQDHFMDGINFDFEGPMSLGSKQSSMYTQLVQETADAFRNWNPDAQISVDIPFIPYDNDGRHFDWLGLAAAADLVFVMSYDMQAQIYGRCVASANSPLAYVEKGLRAWLELGIPRHKMVLGVAWYGYDYTCQPDAHGRPPSSGLDICQIQAVEYRGAPCSDAGGSQRDYHDYMQMIREGLNTTPVVLDRLSACPTFNYQDAQGQIHQVWFETPSSLALKYRLARDLRLGGVGMWNLGSVDSGSSDPQIVQETQQMWEAVKVFTAGAEPSSLVPPLNAP